MIGDRYQQILETAPDAMVIVESDGTMAFVNRQTEKLFGYARADLLGKHLDVLIPSRFHRTHHGHVGRYFSRSETRPMGSGLELFGQRADGTEIPIEVSLSPVQTAEGMLVSAAIRDITNRKHLEAELREAQAAAEAGSAAKSEFLSSMSHELRTPLNAILGFAQLLHRDKKEPLSERHRDRAAHILKGGEHLLRLIDDILDLSRIEAGGISTSAETVHIAEALETARATLEPLAARDGITLAISPLPADIETVNADRTRFVQILMNLGSNAIKYNRPNGKVTFSVTYGATGNIRVSVTDTGIGIASENQTKLFQPFQRAGQETGPIEGTGIGLVITRRLAELMGGSVGFVSVEGVGSTFWVEVPPPVAEALAPPAPVTHDVGSAPRLGDDERLILYVEDNPANVAFMTDALSNFATLELISAPTAEMGIELARARPPAVIIMDINLPGISGLDALLALKQFPETRDIPIIALTAAASPRDRQRGEQAGFFRYLTKPVQLDELEDALAALFRAL